jgi:hypothetical protein
MPKRPRGELRAAHVTRNAGKVIAIASGEKAEELSGSTKSDAAAGKALAARTTPERRRETLGPPPPNGGSANPAYRVGQQTLPSAGGTPSTLAATGATNATNPYG